MGESDIRSLSDAESTCSVTAACPHQSLMPAVRTIQENSPMSLFVREFGTQAHSTQNLFR
jgi:hypothetical protein